MTWTWSTGDRTSYRSDDGAYIERGSDGMWVVYNTDNEGHVLVKSISPLVFVPPAAPETFATLAEAIQWADEHIPCR